MTITGGELLLDLIEGNGIEYIFCSPGWNGRRSGKVWSNINHQKSTCKVR